MPYINNVVCINKTNKRDAKRGVRSRIHTQNTPSHISCLFHPKCLFISYDSIENSIRWMKYRCALLAVSVNAISSEQWVWEREWKNSGENIFVVFRQWLSRFISLFVCSTSALYYCELCSLFMKIKYHSIRNSPEMMILFLKYFFLFTAFLPFVHLLYTRLNSSHLN